MKGKQALLAGGEKRARGCCLASEWEKILQAPNDKERLGLGLLAGGLCFLASTRVLHQDAGQAVGEAEDHLDPITAADITAPVKNRAVFCPKDGQNKLRVFVAISEPWRAVDKIVNKVKVRLYLIIFVCRSFHPSNPGRHSPDPGRRGWDETTDKTLTCRHHVEAGLRSHSGDIMGSCVAKQLSSGHWSQFDLLHLRSTADALRLSRMLPEVESAELSMPRTPNPRRDRRPPYISRRGLWARKCPPQQMGGRPELQNLRRPLSSVATG
ncbi:hypothetical protein B0T16DRAFT_72652 [Cercophora newfieldiana]|uniref:Uncharacterized protein n=1 Tax=Cercophora newfieldiana TaxID=92897 RepID=A0AA39YE99_9PEZI|nr:hypothetical protein B0T16DRAFT_72652 [Cercophora newfieldiana]